MEAALTALVSGTIRDTLQRAGMDGPTVDAKIQEHAPTIAAGIQRLLREDLETYVLVDRAYPLPEDGQGNILEDDPPLLHLHWTVETLLDTAITRVVASGIYSILCDVLEMRKTTAQNLARYQQKADPQTLRLQH